MTTKPTTDIENARKEGEFRGQVLSKLSSLEAAVVAFTNSQISLEGRQRTTEGIVQQVESSHKALSEEFTHQVNVVGPELTRNNEDAHKRLHDRIDAIKYKLAYYAGGLAVFMALIGLIVNYYSSHH